MIKKLNISLMIINCFIGDILVYFALTYSDWTFRVLNDYNAKLKKDSVEF